MNIEVLAAELVAGHPITFAYDADDAIAADQLNAKNVARNVTSVTGQEVFEAATATDYAALSVEHKTLFLGIVGMGTILVNGVNTKAALLAMFGPGTDTRANLAALQQETVSRAVELGLGFVYQGHIEAARAS